MAKYRKKPNKNLSPEMKNKIEQAANDLLQKLPADDPAGLFETAMEELGGFETEFIAHLAYEKRVEVINYLLELKEDLEDKAVLKTIRKAVYSLEQAGIEPDTSYKNRGRSLFKPPAERPALGYISLYDKPDIRYGLLCIPAQPRGINVCSFVISQSQGFDECDSFHLTESALKQFVKKLSGREERLLFEVPPEHIRFLLQEAVSRTVELGRTVPTEYEEFLRLGQDVPLLEEQIAYNLIETDQLAGKVNLKNMAARLLEHKFLASWILIDELEPYYQKFSEIENSLLVLNEAQKAEQRRAVYETAEKEIFNPEMTAVLKRRLEETALIFLVEGEAELAEGALALAVNLNEEASLLRRPVFIQALVELSFDLNTAEVKDQDLAAGMVRDTESGLILPAGARKSDQEHGR